MLKKKIKAPFVPSKGKENYDSVQKIKRMYDSDEDKDAVKLLKKEDVQNFFSGYYYSAEEHSASNKVTDI